MATGDSVYLGEMESKIDTADMNCRPERIVWRVRFGPVWRRDRGFSAVDPSLACAVDAALRQAFGLDNKTMVVSYHPEVIGSNGNLIRRVSIILQDGRVLVAEGREEALAIVKALLDYYQGQETPNKVSVMGSLAPFVA